MAAGDVSPKESFAPRGTTGRKDDARRTGGQAATPTEVAAQAEDSASQVPAERRRVTGKNWKATDVSYEELRWHFLQVPTIEAASRKSILLTKREEAAGAVTSSGGKKAEENDSSPEQPASLAAPSPTSASSSQKDEEELKTEAPQVEHAPRRPRGESKGRGRRGPGRGAPREQSQDPELSPVSALRESAELREKRKEMLQGGADESDSSPEKPALAAPDPTDASSKDSEPEDSLKTEEIAEEAPALLSAAPPRREAEETPSTAEPSVSAPGPAPGSAPSQKGTKTEDPLKTEALTLEIPVTPGQSWRKMHISPCKERRRRPGSTSPKSSRNACVTGTAESRTKSLGAGDDSPKNHWKGSAQQPEEEAKKPRIKELRKQNAELEALSTKDTPTPPSASPKDQIWSRLHDMHRELDERRKELVEQKRREVQEQETEIRAKCRTFRQAQTSEAELVDRPGQAAGRCSMVLSR
ncbi:unnamed protein product [Durusdinium trenchii]|uniref:Uncharacterized protein n=1 Tax=Durusdinium trenchii TaxID=1381693 RepID=A0ABP0KTN7_9DINO